ncbi:hypothetical protein HC752_21995 [Vibrio sp. S9_S30]|uniref:hypothetical protein n=1 Tax=Vibrio sp. S9_S30 TaxID=2720226 RepID=UPI00168019BD|nr:hypothetical protein [Vibrio sp. S9_S30]MBD1559620.1 hypothetical protein [Vibrio sp. S9_S30]
MNRLEKLQQLLQSATAAVTVNNVHLANVTGFSRPSISEAIRSGKINDRMNRTLDFIDLFIHAYGIADLWQFAENQEIQLETTIAEWASPKLDKMLNARKVLEENPLDIVDVYGVTEVPDWLPLQLQDQAHKLTDSQLRQVVEIGEISQQGAVGAFKEFIKNSSGIDASEGKEAA